MKAEPVSEQERQESNMDTSITVPYPLVALKSMVVFPRTRITLSMLREKSIRAVEEAMMHPRRVLITASQLDSEIEDPEPKDIYAFGTLVEITTMHRQQDGSFQVLFNGLRRVHRSEEHTSELQSQFHLVCRLLLEKKKKTTSSVNSQKIKHHTNRINTTDSSK